MISRIGRSWLLALFALLWAFLAFGLAALGLNERFIDTTGGGWFVFLLIPIALTIPVAILALLLSLLPAKNGNESHAAHFLGFFLALLIVPLAGGLLHGTVMRILEGSTALALIVEIAALSVLAVGAFRIGRIVARRFTREGRPLTVLVLVPLILLLLLPPIGKWFSDRPIAWEEGPRTLVLCVDGATWKIIDRMTDEEKLPTFRALQEAGTRFDLGAEPPLMSPIIWTTLASGVGPEEHGIRSFYGSAATVTAPRIWDMVEQKGGSVGLLGWPITWPPRPVDGFLIPSLFARGPETYPESLQFIRELAMSEKGRRSRSLGKYTVYGIRLVQYGVKLSTLHEAVRTVTGGGDFLEQMSAKRFLKLRIHGDLFLELWERYQPGFAAFYNNGVDVTCHYFWKYYEPSAFPEVTPEDAARYGSTIPDIYEATDAVLANILRFAPADARLVLLSDHGLRAMETEESGSVRLIRTENFLRVFELEETVEGVNLSSRVHLRPKRGRGFPSGLVDYLADVVIEETGDSLFITKIDPSGSLLIRVRPGVDIVGKTVLIPGGKTCPSDEIVEETYARISGEHNEDALLLFAGGPVRRGARGGAATLYDVAPSILYLMDLPVSSGMKGRVLEAAYPPGRFDEHPVRYGTYSFTAEPAPVDESAADDSMLKEQLSALGYLN